MQRSQKSSKKFNKASTKLLRGAVPLMTRHILHFSRRHVQTRLRRFSTLSGGPVEPRALVIVETNMQYVSHTQMIVQCALYVRLVTIPFRDITGRRRTFATAAIKDNFLLRSWLIPAETRFERLVAEMERVCEHRQR